MSRRYTTLDELDRLGAEVIAAPPRRAAGPTCAWRDGCSKRAITGERYCFEHGTVVEQNERHRRERQEREQLERLERERIALLPRMCQQPACMGWPDRPAVSGQLSCDECTQRLNARCERLRRGAERERR